jgi:hypothetical protein
MVWSAGFWARRIDPMLDSAESCRVGGAVNAGPLGPPVGGALTAPVVQLSPATMGSDRRLAVVVAWWLDTADLTSAQRLERGDREARRPAIPSR